MGLPARLRDALRRGWRRLAGSPSRAELFYSRRYRLELTGTAVDPLRGERVLVSLMSQGLLGESRVRRPEAASYRQLRRVHTDDYLDSLALPGALTRIVGLYLPDPLPDRVIEAQRRMVGGTLGAARAALGRAGVAANLGGGLHHAFADRGERFCIFNDVAVAIAELREEGFAAPVLVVDLDVHDGDGTRSLFAADPTVHTFSVHNRTGPPFEAVAATIVELGSGIDDGPYLEAVRSRLPGLVEAVQPGLVFYLAGCDAAADDEIGDWQISAAGLLERDRFVVDCLRGDDLSIPLVVLLAGGYGPNAWRYSARFLGWLLTGGVVEPPSTEEVTLAQYRRIAERLSPEELTGEPARSAEDWGLTAEDLGALGGLKPRTRFLGYYSLQGLELVLERSGFLERLRRRGFARPTAELDLDNPGGETLRLWSGPDRRELLMELRVRIDRQLLPGTALLRIEWLLLQNPRAGFTPERPRLPGQQHPGLGILPDVMALLVLACERLRLDGLLFIPSHFHTACQGRKLLRFADPRHEGLFRSLEAALDARPLADASHAVEGGRVVDSRTGEPFHWRPMEMVLPVSDRLRERFAAAAYEQEAAAAAAERSFEVRPA